MDTTNASDTTTPVHRPGSPAPQVWPTLRSPDAPALIDWLVDVAGFERRLVVQHDDVVEHAQLAWPEGGGVMLGSARDDTPWDVPAGQASCYVATDRAQVIYDRVVASGARLLHDWVEEDYGNRSFACADPDGNHWSFGHYRGEPAGTD